MARDNGGIIGPANNPTSSTASGVWDLQAQYQAISGGNWPPIPTIAENSLRFNSGSSDYLNRTPASSGNRKTFTFSSWFKRSVLGASKRFFDVGTGTGDGDRFLIQYYSTGDTLAVMGGATNWRITSQVFRDVSAWYHIVVAVDTTQATASDRIKVYVNGSQITSFSTSNDPSLNFDLGTNSTSLHTIGSSTAPGVYYDGYMSEVILVDGQQLEPTSFGQFNANGIWTPILIGISSYGTNGFRLKFENSASLGLDSSPNGNNWTVNNLTSIDQSTDIPTNNFATLNPLNQGSAVTLSDGNLSWTQSASWNGVTGTIGVDTGKWYWEIKAGGVNSGGAIVVGVAGINFDITTEPGTGTDSWRYRSDDGSIRGGGNYTNPWGSTWTSGDIINIALDCDNSAIYFGKNGVWQNSGDPTSGASKTGAAFTDITQLVVPVVGTYNSSSASNMNFGSPPFTIASGNSDANGYGNFEYAVPSGYYALNTKNLAEFG
jgi:hypothetical protein